MIFSYSHDGLSYAAQPDGYVAAAGEIVFETQPTPDDLATAFPGYSAAVAALTAATERQEIIVQLAALDPDMPRIFEDCITAFAWDTTKLPQVQQDRLARKQSLRAELAGTT